MALATVTTTLAAIRRMRLPGAGSGLRYSGARAHWGLRSGNSMSRRALATLFGSKRTSSPQTTTSPPETPREPQQQPSEAPRPRTLSPQSATNGADSDDTAEQQIRRSAPIVKRYALWAASVRAIESLRTTAPMHSRQPLPPAAAATPATATSSAPLPTTTDPPTALPTTPLSAVAAAAAAAAAASTLTDSASASAAGNADPEKLPLFHDPVSEWLSGDDDDRNTALQRVRKLSTLHCGLEPHPLLRFDALTDHASMSERMLLLRTRFYDDFVMQCLQHIAPPTIAGVTTSFGAPLPNADGTGGSGAPALPRAQVVLLSDSEFDTRAYRLPFPHHLHTTVFEIATADLLQYKHLVLDYADAKQRSDRVDASANARNGRTRQSDEQTRLVGAIRCQRRVAVGVSSLWSDQWEDQLLAGGFDPAVPSVWVLDHVAPFVDLVDLERLLTRISALASRPVGVISPFDESKTRVAAEADAEAKGETHPGGGTGDKVVFARGGTSWLALDAPSTEMIRTLGHHEILQSLHHQTAKRKRNVEPRPYAWGLPPARNTPPEQWLREQLQRAGRPRLGALRAFEYGDDGLHFGRWPGTPLPRWVPVVGRHWFLTAQLL